MTPHTLLVGTIGEGVFRSLDHGATFRRAMDGTFVECDVRALMVHSQRPRTVFLGSELGLLRSDDGADNWKRIESPMNDLPLWSLYQIGEVLFAGACPSRLFRSEDGGANWQETTLNVEQNCPRIMKTRVTTIAGDGETVWAGIEIDSVWRSRDTGQTWAKVPNGLSSPDIHNLVVVPAHDNLPRRIVAATNNDINLSDDDGENWRRLDIGKQVPRSYCRGMKQVIGKPERILLGIGDGPPGWSGLIVVSDDAGETWQVASMPGRANSTIWNFAMHVADPALIYASSVSGQVYRSVDAGESWLKLACEFGEIRALAWIPV